VGTSMFNNYVENTAPALAPTATGTAIKTHQQIGTSASVGLQVVEWSISFDGTTAGTPIPVELIDAGPAATVPLLLPATSSNCQTRT
jgi:hypothetical protein